MKELKFRAWDKQSKRMRVVNTMTFHYEHEAFEYDNSRLPQVVKLWGKDIIEDKEIIISRDLEKVIFMQYVGIKDINGVDIYEGDILEATCRKPIEYNQSHLQFKVPGRENNLTQYWTVEHKIFDCFIGYMVYVAGTRWGRMISNDVIYNCQCKVVGNIYENKELLQVPRKNAELKK